MKRKSIISVLMLLVMVFALAGCKKTPAIVGAWTGKTIESAGISMDMEKFAEQLGEAGANFKMTMDVKEDNTFSVDFNGETEQGTWKEDGDKYTLTVDGEDQVVTIEDNQLVFEMTEEGQTVRLIFAK